MLPEFKKRIDTLRQILVGAVPSPAGQIEQITFALIYKFMNDIDDRATNLPDGKRTYFVGDYDKYSWRNIMTPTLGAHDRLTLYREALASLARNPNLPELFQSIYQNAYLPFNDPRVLTLFLKEVDHFKHSNSDDIGNAYEYLLQITGAQGDVGQFRTPRHIINFIVGAIAPTKSDSVLDPACGTAGFLISAYNYVKHQHDGVDNITGEPNSEIELNSDERDKLHKNYHGFDIDPTMVRTAKVNMYLHGFKEPDIKNHDSLSSEDFWNERYDVILANPPFMTPKGGIVPHKKFGVQSNRAEVLFVDYIKSHLKPTGRAGIIVPEGIIFQSGNTYKQLRKSLVEDGLYAVVSMPSGIFAPYSGVKTSVLLFDNEITKIKKEILFIKVSNDGFDLGAQRREITSNDLPKALEILNKWKKSKKVDDKIVTYVDKAKIAESGDYNLSGDRYRTVTDYSNSKWPILKLGDVISLNFGERITKNDELGTKYPVYGGGGESFRTDEFNRENEYVIARFAMSERCVRFVADKFWMMDSGGTFLIKPKFLDKLSKDFVGKILISRQKDIFMCARGGAQKNLNNDYFYELEIPLPPLEVQEQIVAELDNYQNIINGAKQIIDNWKPKIDIDSKWEKKKLGEVLNTISPPCRIQKSAYLKEGKYPIIDQSQNDITGWTNDINAIINIPKPIVIFGDHTCAIKYSSAKFAQGADGIKILMTDDNLIPEFLYYYLLAFPIQSDGYKRHYRKLVESEISIPSLDVQEKIVERIKAESTLVESAKKLVEIYEQKNEAKIYEIWNKEC